MTVAPLVVPLAGGNSLWVLVLAIALVVGGIIMVTWSKTSGR